MIPHEILKKIRRSEIRTSRLVIESLAGIVAGGLFDCSLGSSVIL
jgi:hypothetical protein